MTSSARKKVYVAYTGGTIGMEHTSRGYAPKAGHLGQALKAQPEFQAQSLPEVQLQEYPDLVDSSNITPKHWNYMAEDIANRYQEFDGFVILHGTDTM
ncbi:MAG: L-asparaginase 1, partial [Gammaproteobacteria bacterium]